MNQLTETSLDTLNYLHIQIEKKNLNEEAAVGETIYQSLQFLVDRYGKERADAMLNSIFARINRGM